MAEFRLSGSWLLSSMWDAASASYTACARCTRVPVNEASSFTLRWCVHAAKKARAHKQEMARAKREASVIPDLIFWIESFEADCLKLSKACKSSIIKGLKRTVTRDFKIM